ncbi:MAG TPA: GNAT family N-acetyltransferase [Myxococcales bacterium LLY-WYZ-16_1]|nr:GNAT family N-acetyltransferase [Myxococcales bacterium LLY-WYZ-16_1]
MRVRTATGADGTALVEGNQAMARETEGVELDPQTLRAGVEAVFQDPHKGRYYVAERDGAVVGQLLVTWEWSDWRNRWVWWIQSVYVWPAFRQQGVYRSLYRHVDAEARLAGAAGIRLYVEVDNVRAQAVYRRLGMDGEHYRLFEAMVEG